MLTLYKFELRKILSQKTLWITGGALLVSILLWGIASAVLPANREISNDSMNGYEANRAERAAAKSIEGREIDQTLIDEMRPAYEDFIFNGKTEKALPYLDVYNYVATVMGTNASQEVLKVDSDAFYSQLSQQLNESSPDNAFSITEPMVYRGYYDGWRQLSDIMKVLICMEIMFAAVCLSTVFTVEHTHKTDQLILCSRFGKRRLYKAKLLSGLTVGIGFALILSMLTFGVVSVLFGLDGFNTILQFVLLRPFHLSIGQAVLILFALSFIGVIVVSIVLMVLSELTKNSIATIGIIAGIMIATMFISELPAGLGIISEVWILLPSNLISLNGAFRYSMFDGFAAYQIALFFYLVTAVIFVMIGKRIYNHYQISGR